METILSVERYTAWLLPWIAISVILLMNGRVSQRASIRFETGMIRHGSHTRNPSLETGE